MPFQPHIGDTIQIHALSLTFTGSPDRPTDVHAARGHHSTVYRLSDAQGSLFALKVFDFAWRSPVFAQQAGPLAPYADLPSLSACQRTAIVPVDQAELVILHPELRYAILMPWLEGQTWEALRRAPAEMTREQRLCAARALAETLAAMEQRGLAHCNLNPANLLVDLSDPAQPAIHLVGLEHMAFPGAAFPEGFQVDDPEYACPDDAAPTWGAQADRCAGARLLGELLEWHAGDLPEGAAQKTAALMQRVRRADSLAAYPTLQEWASALTPSQTASSGQSRETPGADRPPAPPTGAAETVTGECSPSTPTARPMGTGTIYATPADRRQEESRAESRPKRSKPGFLDWGFLFLLIMAIHLVYRNVYLDFPYPVQIYLFPVLGPILFIGYTWLRWRKTVRFGWGWLLGSLVAFALPLALTFFINLGIWIGGSPHFLPYLLGSELFLAGLFQSVGRVKQSLDIHRRVPAYVLLVLLTIISLELDSIFKYGWSTIFGFLLLPSFGLLLTIALAYWPCLKDEKSQPSLALARMNIFIAFITLVLLSFALNFAVSAECYSGSPVAVYGDPLRIDKIDEIPAGKKIVTTSISSLGATRFAAYYKLDYVEVEDVTDDSPASRAWIVPGDRIVSIDGTPVTTTSEMQAIITSHHGIPVEIEIMRNSGNFSVWVTPAVIDMSGTPKIGVQIDDEYHIYGYIRNSQMICH